MTNQYRNPLTIGGGDEPPEDPPTQPNKDPIDPPDEESA